MSDFKNWQPHSQPCYPENTHLAISASRNWKSAAGQPPADTPSDDEANFYDAYESSLGWMPSPQ